MSNVLSQAVPVNKVYHAAMPIAGVDSDTYNLVYVDDDGNQHVCTYIWNPQDLAWQPSTGTVIDGNLSVNVTQVESAFAEKTQIVGDYTYEGVAAPGAAQGSSVWRVKRTNTSTLVTTWADGNSNFDNTVTDMSSLSYS